MNEATQKRLPYVRLDAGFHLARIIDMTPAEAGGYFRRLLIAVVTGKRGTMPEADEMLDEAQAYYDQKREAGRIGGKVTQGKQSSGASSGASGDASSHTDIHSGIQIDIQKQRESQGAAGVVALSRIEIPSLEAVKAFGAERGFSPERVEKCFRHYEASGWRDKDGQPVRNWQAKLSSWMNRPELAVPAEPVKEAETPEEIHHREAAKRRGYDIQQAAGVIQAEMSWIAGGERTHHGRDAQAEIDAERKKIFARYGDTGIAELEKALKANE